MTLLEIAACAAWALAVLADIWTTCRGLARGATERNPIILWIMAGTGSEGWIPVKVAVSAVIAATMVLTGLSWLLWPLAALTGWVAWHNWRLVQ